MLTPRQREVLNLSLTGASQKVMASELGISVQTVKNHMIQVYKHFGVTSHPTLLSKINRTYPSMAIRRDNEEMVVYG